MSTVKQYIVLLTKLTLKAKNYPKSDRQLRGVEQDDPSSSTTTIVKEKKTRQRKKQTTKKEKSFMEELDTLFDVSSDKKQQVSFYYSVRQKVMIFPRSA